MRPALESPPNACSAITAISSLTILVRIVPTCKSRLNGRSHRGLALRPHPLFGAARAMRGFTGHLMAIGSPPATPASALPAPTRPPSKSIASPPHRWPLGRFCRSDSSGGSNAGARPRSLRRPHLAAVVIRFTGIERDWPAPPGRRRSDRRGGTDSAPAGLPLGVNHRSAAGRVWNWRFFSAASAVPDRAIEFPREWERRISGNGAVGDEWPWGKGGIAREKGWGMVDCVQPI
jgi:hypothetical protein